MKYLLLLPLLALGLADLTLAPSAPTALEERTYSLSPEEVARVGRSLEAAFGVRVSGQWRTEESDARRREETGRIGVSDHVYGMALDLVGAPARLDALASHLRQRPDVAYVLWRTRGHHDHLHVSWR